MFGIPPETATSLTSTIVLLQIAVGLVITALAAVGYRRNRSQPMLFLAVGIALLTFVSAVFTIAVARTGSVAMTPLVGQLTEFVGLLFVLYSIVLARRQ
ncbi:DUF7521 family protein [Natronobacterium texcoconense]|uniref:Uncharacterized protein n=1 Tax=Natronobacterium texcoconense TaxID=1095778 RepID=A0A1H1GMI4_NATTX|nr:hypothetical protein [Natronobacterium texcoconense]SDR14086.1 hypothetical protein SAMN04489842_2492 [Natronobacterium texcoconense]